MNSAILSVAEPGKIMFFIKVLHAKGRIQSNPGVLKAFA